MPALAKRPSALAEVQVTQINTLTGNIYAMMKESYDFLRKPSNAPTWRDPVCFAIKRCLSHAQNRSFHLLCNLPTLPIHNLRIPFSIPRPRTPSQAEYEVPPAEDTCSSVLEKDRTGVATPTFRARAAESKTRSRGCSPLLATLDTISHSAGPKK